jgi:hypothetical protein
VVVPRRRHSLEISLFLFKRYQVAQQTKEFLAPTVAFQILKLRGGGVVAGKLPTLPSTVIINLDS